MASFKDLALDTTDQAVSASFWSAVLGLEPQWQGPGEPIALRMAGNGAATMDGAAAKARTLWVNAVPEPKSGKARVHLDVHVRSVEEVLALGATVIDESHPWTVCRAPDGLEFCAFVRDEVPAYRLYEIVVDSRDPRALAHWWGERLGAEAGHDEQHPWWWIEGGALPWGMVFAPVPEAKAEKNRVHWDVHGDVAEFVAAGASVLSGPGHDGWRILADPEGNEFCVFAAPA